MEGRNCIDCKLCGMKISKCEVCGAETCYALIFGRICQDCYNNLLTLGIEALKNRNGWAGK
jgi:hypothetical protein